MNKDWLCKLGIHDYSLRELHYTKKVTDEMYQPMWLVEKCIRCRKMGFSETKDTAIIVPMKYARLPGDE